jgi:hypothetical protein
METTLKRTIFALTLAVLAVGAVSQGAQAQAKYTATRVLDLQVGFLFVSDFPDYTRHKFYGYGGWADFDITNHLGIEGEFRQANDTTQGQYQSVGQPNSTVIQHQRSYDGGLRYFRHYGRFAPYAKVVFGVASQEFPPFPPPAPQNVSAGTYNYHFVGYGTGTDIAITTHINARIDFESQSWFAATNSPSPNNIGGLPRGLTPFLYSGGVAWRFGNRDPRP